MSTTVSQLTGIAKAFMKPLSVGIGIGAVGGTAIKLYDNYQKASKEKNVDIFVSSNPAKPQNSGAQPLFGMYRTEYAKAKKRWKSIVSDPDSSAQTKQEAYQHMLDVEQAGKGARETGKNANKVARGATALAVGGAAYATGSAIDHHTAMHGADAVLGVIGSASSAMFDKDVTNKVGDFFADLHDKSSGTRYPDKSTKKIIYDFIMEENSLELGDTFYDETGKKRKLAIPAQQLKTMREHKKEIDEWNERGSTGSSDWETVGSCVYQLENKIMWLADWVAKNHSKNSG